MSGMNGALENKKESTLVSMAILILLFFILGFVTWLNGALIPFFEIAFDLSGSQAYFVVFSFYTAYFVMAIPSSEIIENIGHKNGISVGLIVIAFGALMFYPAAQTRTFFLFLMDLFIMGTGLAILQTAANPYIVVIGSRESAAARISVLRIVNKLAGFMAPLVLTTLVSSNMKEYTKEKIAMLDRVARSQALDSLTLQLQTPYIYMGIVILILAILAKFSPLPEIDLDKDSHVADLSICKQISKVSRYPQLVLGAITLMLYVAAEVIAGLTIGTFGKQLGVYGENGNFYLKLTSFTMTAMLIGYIVGITVIPKYLSQVNALKISGILGIVLVISIVLLSPGIMIQLPLIPALPLVVVLVALFGLVNAFCWPAIWPMVLQHLGGYTNIGGALVIMAIIGGAIFPLLYGALANFIDMVNQTGAVTATAKSGNQLAYLILLPAYLMILFFAVKGINTEDGQKS